MATASKLVVDQLRDSNARVTVDVVDIVTTATLGVKPITAFEGIDGTGATDSTAGFTDVMVAGMTTVIPSGTVVSVAPGVGLAGHLIVDGELILSADCAVTFNVEVRSGSVNVLSGATATFTGDFKANRFDKIFTGAGTVVGIKEAWPEWWGAGYGVDSADAIEAAFNCVKGTGAQFSRGTLHINAAHIERTVTWSFSTNCHIDIVGGGNNIIGGRLICTDDFSGTTGLIVTCDSGSDIASFTINNVAVGNNAAFTATIGVRFKGIGGITQSLVQRLTTHGFAYGIDVLNSRLLDFNDCATWNGGNSPANGMRVWCDGTVSNNLCGDIKIAKCQFEPLGAGTCLTIESDFATTSCGGIHVDATAFYKTAAGTMVNIQASNGGIVQDVFFSESVQLDGFSNRFVNITCSGSGSLVGDIIFNGTYFRGVSGGNGIYLSNTNSGLMYNIRFMGCWFANVVSPFVVASGVKGLSLIGNHWWDPTGSDNMITILGCTGTVISNNVTSRGSSGTFTRFVLLAGASDYSVVTNNACSGMQTIELVNNSQSGTHYTISGNI